MMTNISNCKFGRFQWKAPLSLLLLLLLCLIHLCTVAAATAAPPSSIINIFHSQLMGDRKCKATSPFEWIMSNSFAKCFSLFCIRNPHKKHEPLKITTPRRLYSRNSIGNYSKGEASELCLMKDTVFHPSSCSWIRVSNFVVDEYLGLVKLTIDWGWRSCSTASCSLLIVDLHYMCCVFLRIHLPQYSCYCLD